MKDLHLSSFSEHLNTKFRVHPDESTIVEVELIEATDAGSTPRQERFSLIFRGPREPFLPQSMYRMEHDRMETLDLFLVPVANDEEDGFQYEAVFNRLHKVK